MGSEVRRINSGDILNRRRFLHGSGAVIGGLAVLAAARGKEAADFRVCPKSKAPARRLSVMRLEELTSHAWDMRLTLTCLQGIVNRPR